MDVHPAAKALDRWFDAMSRHWDQTVFAIGMSEPVRHAAARALLARHATTIVSSAPDARGTLVRPTVIALIAACRVIGVRLDAPRWAAAIANAVELDARLEETFALHPNAVPWIEGAVEVFKVQLDDGLVHGGVTDRPTILAQRNRTLAIGLAVNFGMRFLVAYLRRLDPATSLDPLARELQDVLRRA
jgi:hypothetical protein